MEKNIFFYLDDMNEKLSPFVEYLVRVLRVNSKKKSNEILNETLFFLLKN